MDRLLYIAARMLVGVIQRLPLSWAVRLGRWGGTAAWRLDARHRKTAEDNLAAAFPEKTPEEIRALAKENFARIGENFVSAAKTAAMSDAEIRAVLEVSGLEHLPPASDGGRASSLVAAIGHFGNFELYARCAPFIPGRRFATTYRGLRHPSLDRLMQSLRERSGCLYFERRRDAAALKAAMNRGGLFLGLLADQHSSGKGLRLPFLGRDCSISAAPAVFALRYRSPLFTAVCFRTAPGRWRVEIGPEIPTHENGHPRPVADIMGDVNLALEQAVRRDPANWFWVHQRWKPEKRRGAPKTVETGAPDTAV